MARTYKDRPVKIRFPEEYPFHDGEKAKKKRRHDNEWHWLQNEPHWWLNIFERKDRMRTKQELNRFFHDPEYPVQILKKPVKQYYW